jgi:hypothetical protein
MIDMAMREENFFDRHAILRNGFADALKVAARIDDRTHLGLVGPQEGTILLKRRDGNDGGAEI